MHVGQVKKWRLRDIIDFEYFLHSDGVSLSDEDQHYLHERDRKIYLQHVSPFITKGESSGDQFIIQTWLNRRRQEETAEASVLPGEAFENLYSLFKTFFVLIGLALGGGAGLSFLTYSGARPLNVFVYLAIFVFSQVLLLLLLFSLSMYRLKAGSFLSAALLYKVISRLMLRVLATVQSRVSEKLGAERRHRGAAVLGLIMSKGRAYGFIMLLPVFILAQLLALGFNLGLLATTVFKVATSDIAFGWQSTLQLSSSAVYSLVQKIALPWSWFMAGDLAYPSPAQIEGSRIILKEGIYHLSTPDLASWWPFLCCSVLFYGLLPRLLLFGGAIAIQYKQLSSLDFRQGPSEQLLLRMTTPLVSTRGRQVDDGTAFQERAAGGAGEEQIIDDDRRASKDLLVMIPEDIFDDASGPEISAAVQSRFASKIAQLIRINVDYEADMEILKNLQNDKLPTAAEILLIQEAWQPPIVESINFIKNLRQAIGPGPFIRIGLTGKPQPNTIFSPVQDENRKIWTQKVAALGDPGIFTVGMVNNAS